MKADEIIDKIAQLEIEHEDSIKDLIKNLDDGEVISLIHDIKHSANSNCPAIAELIKEVVDIWVTELGWRRVM